MEENCPFPTTIDWEWDRANRRVGPFQLNSPIEKVGELSEKLERYPEEDYDTYSIRGTWGSKLFVKAKGIASIQCGDHFFVDGADVIKMSAQFAFSRFKSNFFVSQQGHGYTDYMNDEKSLKIIVNDEQDSVIWVIYADPYQW